MHLCMLCTRIGPISHIRRTEAVGATQAAFCRQISVKKRTRPIDNKTSMQQVEDR